METVDVLQSGDQNRKAYRTSLDPFVIKVSRLWIHDPGVGFKKLPFAPSRHVLEMENGVHLLNISAGGSLIRIDAPSHLDVPHLIRQQVPDEEQAAAQDTEHLRDVSLSLDLDGDTLLVSCNIVRYKLVRATTKTNQYDLAVRFYTWGVHAHSAVQWRTVRDGNIPPLAAWIVRRQLSKAH